MKTKELIRLLKKADPSGEEECCVENQDIFSVEPWPAYYDGRLQVLSRDPKIKPFYNVVSGKYVDKGTKIMITPLSIEDAIFENPELPVDIPDGDTYHKNKVEKYREESRKLQMEIIK
jgi:hypothetical protein